MNTLLPIPSLPLLRHRHATDIIAWRGGATITVAQFLNDVQALAAQLPEHAHVLNLCHDRYHFSVGFAAAIMRGQINLLPPTQNAEAYRQTVQHFPDAYCLAETQPADCSLPCVLYAELAGAMASPVDPTVPAESTEFSIPMIKTEQIVACLFTSGSTGQPSFHFKRWTTLVASALGEADRLGLDLDSEPGKVTATQAGPFFVATMPSQHMFGLESALMLPWQAAGVLVAERPFFPADIHDVLHSVPAGQGVLVITPFHLRTLLADTQKLPHLKLIISATAPLSVSLAIQAEQRCHAKLMEIYGTTETGQIAMRRTALTAMWRTYSGIQIEERDRQAWASGGHLPSPQPLGDVFDLDAPTRFNLIGRSGDLVNIAGKRTSLNYLNLQLQSIAEVVDGIFVLPHDDEAERDGVSRLRALVVAPNLTGPQLLRQLRQRIDAAFLPRPLIFIDALPRTATGKVTQETLDQLMPQNFSPTTSVVYPNDALLNTDRKLDDDDAFAS